MQRCLTVIVADVDIAACITDGLDKNRVGVFTSLVQRRSTMLPLVVHRRAPLDHTNGLLLAHLAVLRRRDAVHVDVGPPRDLRLGLVHRRRPLQLVEHAAGGIRLLLGLIPRGPWIDRLRWPQKVFEGLFLGLLHICRALRLRCPLIVAVPLITIAFLGTICCLLLHWIPIVRVVVILFIAAGTIGTSRRLLRFADEVQRCLLPRPPIIPWILVVLMQSCCRHLSTSGTLGACGVQQALIA
mmetsp:Transcript_11585/g.29211  ORF Transcript_11585/g.29211 Transcript_11585/m.29211 type:complete len:241 (-) Transcript_11585:15-737(-)